ncbi:hypothetical protein [Pseudomonas aeruginosa]|uniref:hypothetical protein n=1 Tax=Pseudomonas aeruginosa TaxID=287 RepID=UPI0031B6E9C6
MAEISAFERRKLEKVLDMGSGYVLDFTDRTYAEFFIDFRVDIDAAQFRIGGDSKARRMRTFWDFAEPYRRQGAGRADSLRASG